MPRSMPAGTSWPILEGVVTDSNGPVDLTSASVVTLYARLGTEPAIELAATPVLPQTGGDKGRWTADIAPVTFTSTGEYASIVKVQWDAGATNISYFGPDTLTITANPAL
jgi:hypothetical protein